MTSNRFRFFIAAFSLALGSGNCRAGSPNAWEQVAQMGIGMNLGNTFDAPDGEGTWCKQPARPVYFDDFKAAGFKHVRLPVTWGKHLQAAAPYAVDPKFLERVAEVVGWANQRGLIVVLNAHHEEWFKRDPAGQRDRFEALWRQLATRFQGVPDSLLVFEVLNESDPKYIDAAQTTQLNARILQIIRQSNPKRCVVIGGVGDNADRLISDLVVPADPYVIATYHCYDPWFFVCGEPRNPEEARWGSTAQKADYLRTLDRMKAWSDQHRTPVYLGEWATARKCDPSSRAEYYRFVSAQAAARGFSSAIWDDGGDMWIYNRETLQWNSDIVKGVFPSASQTGR